MAPPVEQQGLGVRDLEVEGWWVCGFSPLAKGPRFIRAEKTRLYGIPTLSPGRGCPGLPGRARGHLTNHTDAGRMATCPGLPWVRPFQYQQSLTAAKLRC